MLPVHGDRVHEHAGATQVHDGQVDVRVPGTDVVEVASRQGVAAEIHPTGDDPGHPVLQQSAHDRGQQHAHDTSGVDGRERLDRQGLVAFAQHLPVPGLETPRLEAPALEPLSGARGGEHRLVTGELCPCDAVEVVAVQVGEHDGAGRAPGHGTIRRSGDDGTSFTRPAVPARSARGSTARRTRPGATLRPRQPR